MRTWWLFNRLCVTLVSLVPSVYAQMESPNVFYRSAVEALDKKDCTTAISYLEKYNIERAEGLKNDQKFAGDIDLQIANCRSTPWRVVRIMADAEPSMGAGGAARGSTGSGEEATKIAGRAGVAAAIIATFLGIARVGT